MLLQHCRMPSHAIERGEFVLHYQPQIAVASGAVVGAEGVENADMLEPLRIFQCVVAQGYQFAGPMPAEEFERYLSGKRILQGEGYA
jgi:EAL domain-containing protein (putative c-di-GMP-specific phosphodiesterase class I)